MMTVFAGFMPKEIPKLRSAQYRFNTVVKDSWFDDPLVREIVCAVDKNTHLFGKIFENAKWGTVSSREFSGGVKGLLTIYKDTHEPRAFSSIMFGDNCVPWLGEISFLVDFTLELCHPLGLLGNIPFEAQSYDGSQKLTKAGEIFDYLTEKRLGKRNPGDIEGDFSGYDS